MLDSMKQVGEKKETMKEKRKKQPAPNLEFKLSEIFMIIYGLFSQSVFKSLLISESSWCCLVLQY